jgi:hypothetical protein
MVFAIIPSLLSLQCSKSVKSDDRNTKKKEIQQEVKQESQKNEAVVVETDIRDRNRFKLEVRQAMDKQDFVKLEKIAQTISTNKERFPGGDWKLTRFYEVIDPPQGYRQGQTDWPERLKILQEWANQYPNSTYASIALASGLASVGQFEKAELTLYKVSKKRNECVRWFREMQSIGLGSQWQRGRMEKLLETAIAVEPQYYEAYTGHAQYLLKYFPGEWLQFAEEAGNKIGGDEGDFIYSEICWYISGYSTPIQFFDENKVSWERIKRGFEFRETHYGVSYRYMNALCVLAGAAPDRKTAKALMDRIGDQWEPDFWTDKAQFYSAKKWANWGSKRKAKEQK